MLSSGSHGRLSGVRLGPLSAPDSPLSTKSAATFGFDGVSHRSQQMSPSTNSESVITDITRGSHGNEEEKLNPLKQHVRDGLKVQLKQHVTDGLKVQLKQHVKDGLKVQLKQHVRDGLKVQLKQRDGLKVQLKQYVRDGLKVQLKQHIKDGLKVQLKQHVMVSKYNSNNM